MPTRATTLGELQLARRTGASRDRIRRLVEIGVLRPDDQGRFTWGDVQRVQIAAAYERGGIALEALGEAIRDRRITFEYADRIYPEASPPSGRTVRELTDALGPPGSHLSEIFLNLGLPLPEPDRALTEADERVLLAFFDAWGSPDGSEIPLRAARLLGDATRRAVEGWLELFIEAIDLTPEQRAKMSVDTLGPRMFEPAMRVAQLVEPMAVWLLRRHMEQALNALNVEGMERALEVHGMRPRPAPDPPAIVFADLSGFTRLTEELGDEVAMRQASTLSHLAMSVATAKRGRLVKQLGDGVMLAFDRIGPAVDAALTLHAAAGGAALPPLHIGVSAGPVVERDGDYFGRTVNLASRISAIAKPGETLANETAAAGAVGVDVVAVGPTSLRGMPAAIPLFRIARHASSAG